ncbi:DMT family transporter [Inhella gelatinilytica]|uniref:DMT family transporter n=1 Tax=Inhella gelatinilytica TaxID=2795030 RepID=A0A931IX88_9BURK|nr:DMT family transporter [Inhella gelatinilytica]MBH9552328.1 DMT family transporter [Inhella gelatinilytica]
MTAAKPSSVGVGLALAGLGAVGFSGKAIIAKLAYRHGVDAVTVLMWRMVLAAPLFLALAWWAGRGQAKLTRADWRDVLFLGFTGYYLASALDFAGLQYISAGLERLILYLNPTMVLLFGVFMQGQRVQPRQGWALGVSYAGVVLAFGQEVNLGAGGDTALGSALVLGSALSYAVYLSRSGQVVGRLGTLRLTGLATSVACALCLLQFVLLKPLNAAWVPAPVLGLSLLNATLCTFVPVLAVMAAVQRLGAPLAAQVGMVGPFSTLLLASWLLGEVFTPGMLAGTVMVLAGVWAVSRRA